MGWTFSSRWSSPKDVRETLNRERGSLDIIDQKATAYGRHLWTVYQTKNGERFIHLDLIEKGDSGYGYKDIEESMGPCYYDCPLSLLEAAGPTTNQGANKWRENVRQNAARRSRKLDVGTKILLYGKNYNVIEVGRRNLVRRDDGKVYRLSRRCIESMEIVA